MKVKVDITQNLGQMEDYLTDDASTIKSIIAKDSTQHQQHCRQPPRPSRQKNAPLNIVLFYADYWTMNVLKQHGYCTGLVGKWHALKAKEYISQAFHHI